MRDYLDSLVVTVTVKNTVNGDTTQIVSTIGFIKEPYSAYNQNQYEIGSDRTYPPETAMGFFPERRSPQRTLIS